MTQAGVSLQLRARTELIDTSPNLLDHLGVDGCAWLDGPRGFVTAGIAATVAPEDAVALVASIRHEAAPDAPRIGGPRAIGSLPFAGGGRLVVPTRIVGRGDDGRTWCTTIDRAGAPPELQVAPAEPTRFHVAPNWSEAGWHEAVTAVLDEIAAGSAQKAVLARAVTVEADHAFVMRSVLARLHATQPGCVVYADGGFVGASPELLVRRRGADVLCRPLAGTALSIDALLASEKDRREHQLVVDAVVDALAPHCEVVHADRAAPLALADVTHLATLVTARAAHATAVDLALALHPTPAVAGTPRAEALALIAALEPTPRGQYAGPCGWVDARGDGDFVVALRGGAIDGGRAVLHAGAGIVLGSDPAAEWAETGAKLRPMLAALIAP